jgi:hypothetical protein
MAKAAAKSTSKAQTAKPRAPRSKASTSNGVEQINEETLRKLTELGIEEQLQRDIEWCLGSYRSDQNPVGLYETARRALAVFQAEKEKKTKGITAKLISDLERVIKQRPA